MLGLTSHHYTRGTETATVQKDYREQKDSNGPVSEATSLKEEITAGHRAHLAGLLQSGGERDRYTHRGFVVIYFGMIEVFVLLLRPPSSVPCSNTRTIRTRTT